MTNIQKNIYNEHSLELMYEIEKEIDALINI